MSNARKLADNLPSVGQLGGRNLVINGAMEVSQRGTSFTADGYSIDRFYHQLSGGTSTLTQETFALGSELEGFTKYLKMVVATGNDYCGILHKVEDVKSLPQGKATLSFYAKGTNPAAGSLEVKIFRMHNGSTVHDTLLNTTVTLTSSWQRFTNTFDVGSLSGMATPTDNSLIYIAIRQSGSDTGTAAWELNLTGVQLEVGPQATPFEHEPEAVTLSKCQRYFYSAGHQNGHVTVRYGASTYRSRMYFEKRMRANPTITISHVSGSNIRVYASNGTSEDQALSDIETNNISRNGFRLQFNNVGMSGDSGYILYLQYTADAEL